MCACWPTDPQMEPAGAAKRRASAPRVRRGVWPRIATCKLGPAGSRARTGPSPFDQRAGGAQRVGGACRRQCRTVGSSPLEHKRPPTTAMASRFQLGGVCSSVAAGRRASPRRSAATVVGSRDHQAMVASCQRSVGAVATCSSCQHPSSHLGDGHAPCARGRAKRRPISSPARLANGFARPGCCGSLGNRDATLAPGSTHLLATCCPHDGTAQLLPVSWCARSVAHRICWATGGS